MLLALWQFHGLVRHTDAPLSTVIASFLFFPVTRQDGGVQPILLLGWTLEYEMFFYGCFALALLNRRNVGLGALAATFIAFVLVGRFIPSLITPLRFWSDPIIVEFLLGILLAHLYLRRVRVDFRAQGALLVIGFGLMIIMGPLQHLDRWIWGGLPAFVLVFGLALGPEWRVRALSVGGDASYSFYLSHPFTLNALAAFWTKAHLPPSGWGYVAVGMIVCVAVALGVYRFVEVPMLSILRRRFEPTRAEVSA
jgi:exopolysaccharide production protein ExoZ